jgi:hypothetical protein
MLELQKIGGPLGAAVHTISITLNTRTPAAQKVVAVPRSLGLRPLAPLVIIWELAFFLQSTKVPAAGAAAASPRCRTQPRLLVRAPPRLTEPLQLGSPQEKHKAGHEVGGDQARTEKKFICTPLSGSSVKIAFVLRASAI